MITAIILTKNEEKNISDCIKSLSWCDEILVVDDNSEDKTQDIAKSLKAVIYEHALSNFSDQRNFALEKAKSEWALFIDADERISPALCFEIMQHINDPTEHIAGFYMRRKDILWGKELNHGESSTIKLLRLAKKNSGKWSGDVHEKWDIAGNTNTLINPLYHYPHQSVGEFLSEINYYTDLRALELFKQQTRTGWVSIIIYPKVKFILNYVLRLGFLDGIPGLVNALMMSFHSFLVRGKLWLLWENQFLTSKKSKPENKKR